MLMSSKQGVVWLNWRRHNATENIVISFPSLFAHYYAKPMLSTGRNVSGYIPSKVFAKLIQYKWSKFWGFPHLLSWLVLKTPIYCKADSEVACPHQTLSLRYCLGTYLCLTFCLSFRKWRRVPATTLCYWASDSHQRAGAWYHWWALASPMEKALLRAVSVWVSVLYHTGIRRQARAELHWE